jgi:hypothetical protein
VLPDPAVMLLVKVSWEDWIVLKMADEEDRCSYTIQFMSITLLGIVNTQSRSCDVAQATVITCFEEGMQCWSQKYSCKVYSWAPKDSGWRRSSAAGSTLVNGCLVDDTSRVSKPST